VNGNSALCSFEAFLPLVYPYRALHAQSSSEAQWTDEAVRRLFQGIEESETSAPLIELFFYYL
jgi:hypothetical protein